MDLRDACEQCGKVVGGRSLVFFVRNVSRFYVSRFACVFRSAFRCLSFRMVFSGCVHGRVHVFIW